ncbi:MAG: spore germination protein [Acutalibacteraceae bacterium]
MLKFFRESMEKSYAPLHKPSISAQASKIRMSLSENTFYIRTRCGNSVDISMRNVDVSGIDGFFLYCDGMCNGITVNNNVIEPILKAENLPQDPKGKYDAIRDRIVGEVDVKELIDLEEAMQLSMSGFAIFFLDGVDRALAFSVQGFETRSVGDPITDVQARGSREGFVEHYKINMTLIRRRLMTPDLRFEIQELGVTSRTKICICYLADRVDCEVLCQVKARLVSAEYDVVLSSGNIQPLLDADKPAIFSAVGVTERPDVFCAKLAEGKIGFIVDGTPYALYVPHVFTEEFQSLDDYATRPYYATFIRILKWLSFLFSFLLPGFYVSMGVFHQELFPEDMLFQILSAEMQTPFPIMVEALIIHFIFEIMREAGLRMPKAIGPAVSIVGALVIGDAAVTAGLMATPMLIVVALTAISSFVVPSIYEPVAILRFLFIIVGGILGFYGIVIALGLLVTNMSSINPYGVPYTAPLLPATPAAARDTILRVGWKHLSKRRLETTKLNS